MNILFFGNLVDITQKAQEALSGTTNTQTLQALLCKKYPALQSVKYFIAVNGKMIQENTPLKEGDTVALMPPFSGG
ncbi:MoaD/ThiS family protein [Hydrotalea sp.]|uniref:MoaD/ThiS family protein n=1 Tax=Hydrotalea sp. TaxID=2881279 RepID=UPI002629A677|nr:MoaD/ThiS family protein [Hydrotalea sp.]